jgi:hypothetical protein
MIITAVLLPLSAATVNYGLPQLVPRHRRADVSDVCNSDGVEKGRNATSTVGTRPRSVGHDVYPEVAKLTLLGWTCQLRRFPCRCKVFSSKGSELSARSCPVSYTPARRRSLFPGQIPWWHHTDQKCFSNNSHGFSRPTSGLNGPTVGREPTCDSSDNGQCSLQ